MRGLILVASATVTLAIVYMGWSVTDPETQKDRRSALPVGKIEGMVLGADGKPEPAVVHLQQYLLGGCAETSTADTGGKFTVNGLPLGRYWVSIRGDLVADIELTPSQPNAAVKLQAPPWSVLRGVVRDRATGKPVAGAIVLANLFSSSYVNFKRAELGDRFEWAAYTPARLIERARKQQKPFALTDANGRYEMKIGDERGDFFAVAPGVELFPEGRQLSERVRGVQELDFALERRESFRVRGRVTHADGTPFVRGKIRFFFRRDPHYYRELMTDEKGYYTFIPTTFLTRTAWLEVAGYSIMHQEVPLDKNPPFPPVNWILRQSQKGTLSVTAQLASGKPVPDGTWVGGWRDGAQADAPRKGTPGPHIYYRAEAESWGLSGQGVNLVKGKAQLEMEPGTYAFAVSLSPLTGAPEAARRNLTTSFTFRPDTTAFSIAPGATTELALMAPRACAVTAVVTDPNRAPVPGVNVAVFRWDDRTQRYSGDWGAGNTNDKGEILFDPMQPGQYVFHPATGSSDFETLRRYPVTLTPGKHERIRMTVTARELEQLRQQTQRRFDLTVRGQVLMPDGVTPAAFAAVYGESRSDGWVREEAPLTHADSAGKFTLTNQVSGSVAISARSHGTALTRTTCTLGGAETPSVRLVLQSAATVQGRVLNADGTPGQDVRLWLGKPTMSAPAAWGDPYGNGSFLITTPARRDGHFTLHGVAPGKQQLCVYRNGRLEIDRILTLDIQPGEVRKGVQVTLEPQRPGLEVRFERPGGKPVPAGYEVRLHSEYGPFHCGGMEEQVAGAHSRGPLPVGRYHLWLEPPSYARRDLDLLPGVIVRNIHIRPGKDTHQLKVPLPVAGAVQGRVLLPDGTPAAALRVAVNVPGASGEDNTYPPLALLRERDGPPSYARTSIAPDGYYTLHGLAPGRYRLSVTWHGRGAPLFISEPLEVTSGRITAAGTWTIKQAD